MPRKLKGSQGYTNSNYYFSPVSLNSIFAISRRSETMPSSFENVISSSIKSSSASWCEQLCPT